MANAVFEDILALDLFLREKKIMVVTDEYPPTSVGGAEISLHTHLQKWKNKKEIVLIKFQEGIERAEFYRIDGVDVVKFPDRKAFDSYSGSVVVRTLCKMSIGPISIGDIVFGIRNVWNFGFRRERIKAYWALLVKRKPKGGVLLDFLPEQFYFRVLVIHDLLRRTDIRFILANNTRSILTFHYFSRLRPEMRAKISMVGYVRDNRFNCARYTQMLRHSGQDCAKCDFGCAVLDHPAAPIRQMYLLSKVQEVRQRALDQFDRIVVTSRFLEEQISNVVKDRGRIRLVPNFVGDSGPEAPTQVQEGAFRLLVVGSLNEAKGQYEFVLNSIDRLRPRGGYEVRFAGRGERIKRKICDLIMREDVEDSVKFLGFLDRKKLFEEIRNADVIVLPTLWREPFGRVPLEAAACKRAVVGFSTPAFEETIVDGETGYLVPRGDYNALWDKIDVLKDDLEYRTVMGEKAFRYCQKKYSADASFADFSSVMREVGVDC